jgi:hypothetical protein
LLKRTNLSWISIALFTVSFLLNVAYAVIDKVCFSDYHRFEYSFVDEVRWDHMYSLLPEDMIAILDLWREYLI